ncbi:nucleotidyltransferase [Xylanivirga thermophila]|uniref:nucleotidyltransferase n=1 Tax=Xylanivirga thermophila TaxID=2496273 RepID=UPI00101CDF34|nr:nucleotidyltransferase [Xylanivirga thermophila]
MTVLGIVAEYNPFHNGHLYHLRKSIQIIKPDYTIAIMSGHFTQRGEPALLDKWTRTSMALENGVDIVLELPVIYACQTAELFAFGGVELLNKTGVVTHMSFGSETEDMDILQKIANILAEEPLEFKEFLKDELINGVSFPVARYKAIIKYMKINDMDISDTSIKKILNSPNSILAIEYLKALKKTDSQIKPVTFKRIKAQYHSTSLQKGISSATAIRNEIYKSGLSNMVENTLPYSSLIILENAIISGKGPLKAEAFDSLILGLLRRTPADEMANWMDVEEGLQNRIKKCSILARDLKDFLQKSKTKRYTYTRLQRILTNGILNITSEKIEKFGKTGGPQYIRILGFNKKATPLIRQIQNCSSIPVINKAAHYSRFNNKALEDMFHFDVLATDIYALACPNPEYRIGGWDFKKNPVIL